jgi:hypothetical protein
VIAEFDYVVNTIFSEAGKNLFRSFSTALAEDKDAQREAIILMNKLSKMKRGTMLGTWYLTLAGQLIISVLEKDGFINTIADLKSSNSGLEVA